ncbi:hypothetical protein QBC37DRAFT_394883 [Rhypophila decipiens]|uniref:Uncharacterized protein n=1 Tax=Rhypophila decipiens TaxID=261697 RepID=A0AAN6YGZ3_9PEZI|nr:hypothetical protein QBC37DRAFT_394883 [Rhypophila decipiens]
MMFCFVSFRFQNSAVLGGGVAVRSTHGASGVVWSKIGRNSLLIFLYGMNEAVKGDQEFSFDKGCERLRRKLRDGSINWLATDDATARLRSIVIREDRKSASPLQPYPQNLTGKTTCCGIPMLVGDRSTVESKLESQGQGVAFARSSGQEPAASSKVLHPTHRTFAEHSHVVMVTNSPGYCRSSRGYVNRAVRTGCACITFKGLEPWPPHLVRCNGCRSRHYMDRINPYRAGNIPDPAEPVPRPAFEARMDESAAREQ